MQVYSTYHPSPLGVLHIQCTDHAISAVLFCEESGECEEHPLLQLCTSQIDDYFAGTRKEFDLPLNQSGTEFQKKVWELLCTIPYGKTISYHELSKQYGNLRAIRAVAAANGKNNLAIIVPCHRVIGSDQSLTGYAGGLWRKKWLLEHEETHHSGVRQRGLFEEA